MERKIKLIFKELFCKFVCFFVCSTMFCTYAHAQSDTVEAGNGAIMGHAAYNNGLLPFARVAAYRNKQMIKSVHADSNGVYNLKNLPAGWYRLKVTTKYADVLISKPILVKSIEEDVSVCDEFMLTVAKKPAKKSKYSEAPISAMIDSIMVIKSKREMYVYNNKQLLKTYHICLGFTPVGAKQYEGDGKTPEGLYKITDKNPFSTCYKSVGISYPSAGDSEFARKAGKRPGGLVRIHGLPNGEGNNADDYVNEDWTWGCIAVNNKEIDEIFAHINSGTPIFIQP